MNAYMRARPRSIVTAADYDILVGHNPYLRTISQSDDRTITETTRPVT
jgi:hypothetical protein